MKRHFFSFAVVVAVAVCGTALRAQETGDSIVVPADARIAETTIPGNEFPNV